MAVQTKRNRRTSSGGTPAKVSKRQAVEAIFEAEGLPGWLGWGTMGAESTWGSTSSGHYFGLIEPSYSGQVPNGSWIHDAQISAHLYKQLVNQYGSVAAAVPHYSGNSYTVSHVESLGKPKSAGSAQGAELVDLKIPLPEGPVAEEILKGLGGALGFGGSGPAEELGKKAAPTLGPIAESILPAPIVQAGAATVAIITMLTDIHFWIRAGGAIAGLILVYMGLHSLTGQGPTPSSVVQAAAATKGV